MRALYDFQIFYIERRGGITRYFVELARALAQLGSIDIDVVPGTHGSESVSALERLGAAKGPRLKFARFPGSFRLNRYLTEAFLATFKYEIYHPTYYWVFRHPARTRVVLTVHDMIHELFPSLTQPGDRTAELRREALGIADVILCVSENTKRDLLAFYPVGDRPVLVTPLASGLHGIPSGRRVSQRPAILYVGPRKSYKNFALVHRAWSASEALRRDFALVCLGGEAATAEERCMPGETHFLRGDDQLAIDLYSTAEVFVYPSKYEGFGMPVLEAMSYGCPVITTRGGALPEVAGDAAEFIDGEDPEAFLDAVRRLTGESAFRRHKIEQGRLQAARFSWRDCAEHTASAYRSIAS